MLKHVRGMIWSLSLVVCAASLIAAAPPGWKIVKSPQRLTRTANPNDRGGGGQCQIAVPPAMVVDTEADRTVGQTGHMKTPDGNLSVSVQEHPPGETLPEAADVTMKFNRDAKVTERSAKRVWISYQRAGNTMWEVLAAGNPVVCSAHFIIHDARLEDAAKSIVPTLASSK